MTLKLENVNLIYDIGKEVQTYALKNINLSLSGNKLIGIMGPSGSGKSSLLYAMAGFKIPTSGKIQYNNIDYGAISGSKKCDIRKKEFGFIFQRHFLIDYMTVLDNVLTPINDDSKAAKEKAIKLLEKFHLGHLSGKKPHQLSGGQRQKVAIARALISDPQVIFADEPTAALDHNSAIEVMNFLEEYKSERMIMVVTHDPSILTNADSIINMRDGAITSIENKGA
ncbi:ABC transporter ATP-binding protein [Clostridium oryzae]|uniref:Lipoprotein-releasing system ATP-binding protein LolD n=1 Tax=Clostridium oryzae TaxID=1450648 RepID=A0A1V4IQI4_9CLOT|nr:ABC transporter ATP-binding protein [Clostridium oryzae]OPJ62262.1 lipoprotein-releasing system ATP-binding protein LolD [Clostridium oryzae]